MALYRSWLGWPARHVPYGGFQVPETALGHRIVSPRFLRHAHDRGLKVQVWTVDEEAGHETPPRLGRRRADHEPAGPRRAGPRPMVRQQLRSWLNDVLTILSSPRG